MDDITLLSSLPRALTRRTCSRRCRRSAPIFIRYNSLAREYFRPMTVWLILLNVFFLPLLVSRTTRNALNCFSMDTLSNRRMTFLRATVTKERLLGYHYTLIRDDTIFQKKGEKTPSYCRPYSSTREYEIFDIART